MSEKYSIIKTYSIPLKYKEGIYSFNNFENLTGDMLLLDYDESYQILDYILPGSEGPVYRNKITFYSIPQDKFESTLKAFYASEGLFYWLLLCGLLMSFGNLGIGIMQWYMKMQISYFAFRYPVKEMIALMVLLLLFSIIFPGIIMNNSDYLQKARKYGHFTGYKN